jgi:hypothetical protein
MSCSDNKKRNINPILLDAIDTLSRIDYLFTKILVPVKDSINLIDQLTTAMTVDKNNNFYFVGFNQEIYKINSSGEIKGSLKNLGHGPGEYLFINSIVTDQECNIYIADLIGFKIVKFDSLFNYLSEIKSQSVYPMSGMRINSEGNLICFHPTDLMNALYVYDLKNGEFLEKYGVPDVLAHKFGSYNNNTALFNDGNVLYYINPLKYEIFECINGIKKKTIIPQGINHFTEIKERINDRSKEIRNYSIITTLFLIDELMVVGVNNVEFDKDSIHALTKFDIIDQNGNVLKSQLPFKEMAPLMKIDKNRFFSFEYEDLQNSKGYKMNLVIYTLKI